MRTTESQFQLMIDFMERYGDIGRTGKTIHERLRNHEKWEELCGALNIANIGKDKTAEQWKKVWSDLKNNTKRKAARINSGETLRSGLTLTNLEERVIYLLGYKNVTDVKRNLTPHTKYIQPQSATETIEPQSPMDQTRLGYSSPQSESMEPQSPIEEIKVNLSPLEQELESNPTDQVKPRYFILQTKSVEPQSTRDQMKRHQSYSNPEPTKRIRRSPQIDVNEASKQSLDHDADWRNQTTEFITENVKLRERELELQIQWQNLATDFISENVRLREETVRLRERELQQQRQWQTLFTRCLDIFEKFIDGNRE